MMAAILFLCLIASAPAVSSDLNLRTELRETVGAIPQPLFTFSRSLESKSRKLYRGRIDNLINNTVVIEAGGVIGAGAILSDNSVKQIFDASGTEVPQNLSLIVTNFHVIENGSTPNVAFAPEDSSRLADSLKTTATIYSTLPSKDLALLAVNIRPSHVPGVDIAAVSRGNIGDDVEAIGHPNSQFWSYSRGYISQIRKDHEWSYGPKARFKADVIQTQTPISTGSSGGPLFNDLGEMVGVNTMGDDDGQNLNFAVSTTEISKLMASLPSIQQVKKLKSALSIETFAEAQHPNFVMVGEGELSNGTPYQKYQSSTSDSLRFTAIFYDERSVPTIYLRHFEMEETLHFTLSPDHANPAAWFKVLITNDQDELVAEGWDFNGDLFLDYLI